MTVAIFNMGGCITAQQQPLAVKTLPLTDYFQPYKYRLGRPHPFLLPEEARLALQDSQPGRWARWKVRIMDQHVVAVDPQFYRVHNGKPSVHDQQISKDVCRTFPQEYFKAPETELKLSKIIRAVTHYFPKVGYTQGMNFVIGLLLLLSKNQKEAFWMFVHLATNPDFLIIGFYVDGFKLQVFYQFIFFKLLERQLPSLARRLQQLSLDTSAWLFKFIQPIYINFIPLPQLLPYWDFFIFTDGFSLAYLAVSFMEELQNQLLSCELQDSQFICIINKLKSSSFHSPGVIGRVIERANRLRLSKAQIVELAKAFNQPNNQFSTLFQTYSETQYSQMEHISEFYRKNLTQSQVSKDSHPSHQHSQHAKNKRLFQTIRESNEEYQHMGRDVDSSGSNPQDASELQQFTNAIKRARKRSLRKADNKSMVNMTKTGQAKERSINNDIKWFIEQNINQEEEQRQQVVRSEGLHEVVVQRAHSLSRVTLLSEQFVKNDLTVSMIE